MTITSRATRNSDMALTNTGALAGPGAYSLRKPSLHQTTRPNFTGFSNSAPRNMSQGVAPRASLAPGPGSYLTQDTTVQTLPNPTTAGHFRSTAPRLAPAYPGSSAFMPSTIVGNPGPDAYTKPSSVQNAIDAGTRATAIAYGNQLASKGRQILSHIPTQYNPPAIPSKMQVFGYMSSASDECGRVTVAAVAPPAAIIMGVTQGASKGETVGPGQYSQEELFRNGNTLNFNTSKTERALFEPLKTSDNTMAPLSNPGPGYYEAKKASWEGGAGGGSSFKSETKMAHQQSTSLDREAKLTASVGNDLTAGPSGRASSSQSSAVLANFGRRGENWHGESLDDWKDKYAGDGNGGRGSFNTTAIRDTCPRIHSGAVPFETNESKFSTRRIGPGSYEAGRSSFKIKVQKSLREEPVGFSSTNQRPCMKGVKAGAGVQHVIGEEMEEEERNVAPGPDQYNPDYYTMSFKAAKVAQASRKVGVFGTTGARFRPKNELEEKAEVTLEHVGPGSYDVVPQGGIPRPRFPTSSFRGAGRFDTQADFVKTKNGGFLVCGSNDTLVKSPSVVEISGEARPVNTGNYFMSSDDDTIAAHKKTARPGFGASAKRGGEGVNIDGRKISENPGPEYKIDMFNIKRPDRILVHGGGERKEILGGRSTFGKDGRKFDTGNFGPEALGPGSYELPGSINSHSFNITMKAKKTAYRKSRSGGGVGEGGSSSSARQKEEEGGGSGERLEVASLAL